MLLFAILGMVNADNLFIAFGLSTKLGIVPDSAHECHYDDSACYEIICNLLTNGSLCIPYVVMAQASELDCHKLPPIMNTTMLVFGFIFKNTLGSGIHSLKQTQGNFQDKFVDPMVCYNMGECLMKICELYTGSYPPLWAVLTGRCWR